MPAVQINGVPIEDTFAEAFAMAVARVVITADSHHWANTAATTATGYGCSIIGCDAEAGVEGSLTEAASPDGRPGASVLFFAGSRQALERAVVNRVSQCILTCPTTACYNGLPLTEGRESIRVGGRLRFFGDGFQSSKLVGGRRFWRIPVMDGEFLCEDSFATVKGIAGGNLLILGASATETLAAAQAAVEAARTVAGVVLPFPAGITRSGSKVGARYPGMRASTNEAYCPTLRGLVPSAIPAGANTVYEIILDGLSLAAVEAAMAKAIRAACRPGVVGISAGNYGGHLGAFRIELHRVTAPLADSPMKMGSAPC